MGPDDLASAVPLSPPVKVYCKVRFMAVLEVEVALVLSVFASARVMVRFVNSAEAAYRQRNEQRQGSLKPVRRQQNARHGGRRWESQRRLRTLRAWSEASGRPGADQEPSLGFSQAFFMPLSL